VGKVEDGEVDKPDGLMVLNDEVHGPSCCPLTLPGRPEKEINVC
jgi:hypothetical protein